MASFTNRGTKAKPSWQYTISRYIDGKYKPIRKGGFRTRSEAKVVADDIEYKLNTGQRIVNDPIPLAKYFEDWYMLYKTDVAKQTLNHYKDTLRHIKDYFGESKTIQSVTRNEYQLFLNEYGEKYSKETTSKLNGHIRAMAQDAVEDQIIRFDFTRKANVTGKPPKNKKDKYLEFGESEQLYSELFKRLNSGLSYYAVLLLLVSGMRFEEVVGLTRNDFDFKRNTISIDKVWGYNKSMPTGFSETKNPQSIRVLGIDPKVMLEFKKLFLKTPENINRLVFFSPSSKYKVLSNNAINKSLKKALDAVGIKNKVTAHALRHTHASAMIYKKLTIPFICERLGHSSPDITYKRYAHVMEELREEDEQSVVNMY